MCEVQRGTNSRLTVRDTQTYSTVSTFIYTEHTDQDHQTIEKLKSQQPKHVGQIQVISEPIYYAVVTVSSF